MAVKRTTILSVIMASVVMLAGPGDRALATTTGGWSRGAAQSDIASGSVVRGTITVHGSCLLPGAVQTSVQLVSLFAAPLPEASSIGGSVTATMDTTQVPDGLAFLSTTCRTSDESAGILNQPVLVANNRLPLLITKTVSVKAGSATRTTITLKKPTPFAVVLLSGPAGASIRVRGVKGVLLSAFQNGTAITGRPLPPGKYLVDVVTKVSGTVTWRILAFG